MRLPRSVRRLSDPLLERVPVPIVGGVNRGCWWNLSSAGSGYGSGRRARAQMEMIAALIRPGEVIWDVGAHHGYVTLCAAARVGPTGVVHAFEPGPRNRRLLTRHVRWNGVRNAHVHPYALSSFDGTAAFGGSDTSKTQALGAGSDAVEVRTAATLVRSGVSPAPTFLKVDVEGAEAEVVESALEVLPRNARLLVAMHTREADQRCTAMLEAAGFELVPSSGLLRVRAGRWRGDPDLFALGSGYADMDRDRAVLREHGF